MTLWFLFQPLLLILVFLGFYLPSVRWLWAYGFLLGLLKDLTAAGPFGMTAIGFGGTGWLIGQLRHMVERDDPLLVGLWAGVLTALAILLSGLAATALDPAVGWNPWIWVAAPAAAGAQGLIAARVFPPLSKLLFRGSRFSIRHG